MKCSLGISNFFKGSLIFPILLFSSISLHWSLRKPFLSLFAILWNSAFKWEYLYFSPLLFTSLLFTAICKASSDSYFAFLHFFFLGMVLILHKPLSIVHQALCLSDLFLIFMLQISPLILKNMPSHHSVSQEDDKLREEYSCITPRRISKYSSIPKIEC